ncbi:UNVERIFIED_CONTAM: hypothetical protein FKN15_066768 [Acipenser sinensis]
MPVSEENSTSLTTLIRTEGVPVSEENNTSLTTLIRTEVLSVSEDNNTTLTTLIRTEVLSVSEDDITSLTTLIRTEGVSVSEQHIINHSNKNQKVSPCQNNTSLTTLIRTEGVPVSEENSTSLTTLIRTEGVPVSEQHIINHSNKNRRKDFEELIDVVITNALKPGFFSQIPEQRSFRTLVNDEESTEGLPSLDKPGWYSQGNWAHLHELLKTMTGNSEPQGVYFGDSMHSDVFPASCYGHWETVLILEELEGKGAQTSDAKSKDADAEPLEKKGKYDVSFT